MVSTRAQADAARTRRKFPLGLIMPQCTSKTIPQAHGSEAIVLPGAIPRTIGK